MKVKILDKLLNRLSSWKSSCNGLLFGVENKDQDEVYILALQAEGKADLQHSFPGDVSGCGIFEINDEEPQQTPKAPSGNFIIIGTVGSDLKVYDDTQEVEYVTINQQDVLREFVFIRCTGQVPIQCNLPEPASLDSWQMKDPFECRTVAFKLADSKIMLTEKRVISTEGPLRIDELYDYTQNVETTKKKNQTAKQRFLHFETLLRRNEEAKHAPICIINKSASKMLDTVADVDTIVMVPQAVEVWKVHSILMTNLHRFSALFENCIKTFINDYDNKSNHKNFKLDTYHFFAADCGHFVTILYPQSFNEETLKPTRLQLHQQLLLNTFAPTFRRANKFTFQSNNIRNSILINPHEAVKPTENSGEVGLVQGNYEYYHYCQNNADDKGWGCAYRSLQTLASWFKLQGYVDKPVPSLTDIQKCLVDIKDKPASFLGSKQWIGSTEVSFVLSSLLGIESMILHVDSGAEMAQVAPDLLNHFMRHGSPVMIGGGVLAHTILGVDYNRETGDVKFLILDPHYTASEDINVIVSKGWCGWKGTSFWDKGAYYNMCLPQVPRVI